MIADIGHPCNNIAYLCSTQERTLCKKKTRRKNNESWNCLRMEFFGIALPAVPN